MTTPTISNIPPVPSPFADLPTTWAFLEAGMNHIMHARTGIFEATYMGLYTTVYNYCSTADCGQSVQLRGLNLYNNLIRYFKAHLKSLRDQSDSLPDEPLLRYYAEQWVSYVAGAKQIHRLFMFLNRGWVRVQEHRGGFYPVYTLALVLWKANFFFHVQSGHAKLTGIILRLIELQRNGETIDQGPIKIVLDSFVSLGLPEADPERPCLLLYKTQFEEPFIEATKTYYKQESESFLAENGLSDYLKKAEDRLGEEQDRVERCLDISTRNLLIGECEHVLIRDHSELMWENFQSLLDLDRGEDLQRMYSLLSRLPEGLEPLRERFEEHVKHAVLAATAKLVGGGDIEGINCKAYVDALLEVHRKNLDTVLRSFRGEAGFVARLDKVCGEPFERHVRREALDVVARLVGEGGEAIDPKAYVDALLEVHGKHSETLRGYRSAAGFVASLDKACREFVNRNAATATSPSKSPELLAKYVDMLLRNHSKMAEGGDLEGVLHRSMMLFKYIEDKDVFQTFYTIRLSKRLIHGVSASEETEVSMISKLKEVCGFEYTNKLQRMFADLSLSRDLTDEFKICMPQNEDDMNIDFNVMVLGTNFWPLNPPANDFIIPAEILPTFDRFQKYYQIKHSGRKLMWLWNFSKNELKTNYLSQKYILMTSSYQMVVLLQYNNNDTLSLDGLVAATGLSAETLIQVLSPLVKAKILINHEGSQYDLNYGFKSKKIRFNLRRPIKVNVKAETTDVLKRVDEDRKYEIQATIVRIMKLHQTMKNQLLIQEVTSQISRRFTPKIPDIKRGIAMLLEKEYIERLGGGDMYAYVA